jgi:hypothetical protein
MSTPVDSFKSQVDYYQQKLLNHKLRVFADIKNADEEVHIRLNSIGTVDNLVNENIELQDSKVMTLYSATFRSR